MPKILLIEDDKILGGAVAQRLQLEGFELIWATTCAQAAREIQRATYDFVLADIRLPDGSGETVFRDALPHLGKTPIVFVTAFGDVEQAIRLVRAGADDYLTKPFDIESLVAYIRDRLRQADDALPFSQQGYAISPGMAEIADQLRRVAPGNLPVLISGETGTGKSAAARYLHHRSPRADRPFIAVDCGALPDDHVEHLLLGHEAGAFPGALTAYPGFLAETDDGTLFLDNVSELPAKAQALLLRLLDDGQYRKLGGRRDLSFRGRVLAASNADLSALCETGRFRRDLYFRLAVIDIVLPPLRERLADISALADHFLARATRRHNRETLQFEDDALAALHEYDWPGNLRELLNRIERAVVLSQSPVIAAGDLFPERKLDLPTSSNLRQSREEAERREIEIALAQSGGKIGQAAKRLGISRTTLWKKMRQSETGSP